MTGSSRRWKMLAKIPYGVHQPCNACHTMTQLHEILSLRATQLKWNMIGIVAILFLKVCFDDMFSTYPIQLTIIRVWGKSKAYQKIICLNELERFVTNV